MFRLNFSHGSHDEHRARYDLIRAVEAEIGRPIGILADLQGPKLRVEAAGGRPDDPGGRRRGPVRSRPGAGRTRLGAAAAPGGVRGPTRRAAADRRRQDPASRSRRPADRATARVLVGGTLSDRKGLSVVGAAPVSALTEKDRADLAFAVPLGVDWAALSFVQRPEDLDEVRALAPGPVHLVAKLEKPAAVERLDEIVARSTR